MRRYFIWIQYFGKNFSGWQTQPNAPTVQEAVEKALRWTFNSNIRVNGCGRTDAGVHARAYALHADLPEAININIIQRLNRILNPDINVIGFQAVHAGLHARFSATKRTYKYLIDLKTPLFTQDAVFEYPYSPEKLDYNRLPQVARLLLDYDSYFPFCKSKSDAHHYRCKLYVSEWERIKDRYLIYTITANRFLRGMVRLIVGTHLQVAEGKINIEDVRYALDNQKRLNRAYSIPPHGLYLYEVKYEHSMIKHPANDALFFPI